VYNGERYLAQTLDSIIDQTYHNFKLIISDNASTDRTEEICRQYAEKDERIEYNRNPVNKGAAWNFNRVFQLSDSEYFKWVAADDICSLDLLMKCLSVLQSDPSIVLAFGSIKHIDQNGIEFRKWSYPSLISADSPAKRFSYMINSNHSCMAVFGVFRSSVMKNTSLLGNYSSSDENLLAQICLSGKMFEIPDSYFYRRFHNDASCSMYPSEYSRSEWFDPENDGKVVFPGWRLLLEYIRTVRKFSLKPWERVICYFQVIKWIFLNLPYLLKNVIVYTLHLLFKPGFYEAKNRSLTVKTILLNHFKH
jgi:glycosyltransferase involved in cell wall biosynthesis